MNVYEFMTNAQQQQVPKCNPDAKSDKECSGKWVQDKDGKGFHCACDGFDDSETSAPEDHFDDSETSAPEDHFGSHNNGPNNNGPRN